jgi:hypothetical protein
MDFNTLVGKHFLFYGADSHYIRLDDNVYEVVEDPSDGYRSMLDEVIHHGVFTPSGAIFLRTPLAIVEVKRDLSGYKDGYILEDVEYQHCWLEFGTDNTDDYYPMFYFSFTPMLSTLRKRKEELKKQLFVDPLDWLFEQRET